MALSIVTPPTTEPLTLSEVKAHLRLDASNGEPAPTVITCALISPAVAGNVDNGAHRYLATFVTADGETDAGTISAAVTVVDKTINGKVTLSAIPLGGSAVTSRKIYRTTAGGSTYLLQSTISDNTTTTATDNTADSGLGAQAPTTNTTADPELVSWITSARQICETITHRAFITQVWNDIRDSFPCWNEPIWLDKPPVSAIGSITYVDTNGTTQTWSTSYYDTDLPSGPWASRARVTPKYQQIYPVTRDQMNAVTIAFTCGYGAAASVPSPIKSAMKLLIGGWWMNREEMTIDARSGVTLPRGVDELLWPFKAF